MNISGLLSVGGLVPLPQVGQSIAYCHVPLPPALIEPADTEANATAWLFVAAEVKSVSVGVPLRFHSSVCPPAAPVLAKVSPAVSVTVIMTSPAAMSVASTFPNGAVPQVPVQKSDVRGKSSVAADAEVITPTETSAVMIRDDALISCLLRTH